MNNKIIKLVRMTTATGALLVLGLAAPVHAGHPYDPIVCASIGGLYKALGYLDFHDTDDNLSKTHEGLLYKLMDAEDKIDQDKYCDASFKIEDFNTKINQLIDARKPKVGEPHPGTLLCLELGSDAVVEELDPKDKCGSKTKGPRNK